MDPVVDELIDDYVDAKQHLNDLADAVIWMSGSPSFSPEGEAHSGWVETMRPRLFAALEWLDDHPVDQS
jgi:hypothetical protein